MNPIAMFKNPARDSSPPAACDPIACRLADPQSLPVGPGDRCLVALVQSMAARDETALDEFYEATVAHAYGLAKRMTGDAAMAEDIVVEVYFQAWEGAARYDASRAGVLTWLLTICRSRALDELRKRRRDTLLAACAAEIACWQADQSAPSGLDLLLAVEAGGKVRRALALLSPLDRQILGLVYFRDLSHRDISTLMRLPLGTIKSKIRRALQALAPLLAPE